MVICVNRPECPRARASNGTRAIHGLHPNGSISLLAQEPKAGKRPVRLRQIRP